MGRHRQCQGNFRNSRRPRPQWPRTGWPRNQWQRGKDKQKVGRVIGFCLFLAVIIGSGAAAYYLVNGLTYLVGKPSGLFYQLIVFGTGFMVLTLFLKFWGYMMHQFRSQKLQEHMRLFNDTFEAVDRISTGDFNIFIQTENPGPHSELAQKINKMARELKSMEHMRQDFVSNVSHEIQSPLTSICGFAALLKKEDLSSELRQHYLGIIEAESKRLSKLSENLLKLSNLDAENAAIELQSFPLDKQIESALLMLEPQWVEKGIELEIELSKTTFYGDPDLLNQVWVNLLHNSIKFTPEGGQITVNMECASQQVTVKLKDSGIGIAEEDRVHIFERFYKGDKSRERSQGGSGLGLSLVKKIVDLHRGQIKVESTLGEGTMFTVILPNQIIEE